MSGGLCNECRPVVARVPHDEAVQRLESMGIQFIKGDACDPQVVNAACQRAGAQALVILSMGGAQALLCLLSRRGNRYAYRRRLTISGAKEWLLSAGRSG